MKRKLLLAAIVTICLSLLAYGTIAYYTAEQTSHNVITTGSVDIELLEWADTERRTPFPADGIPGAMPGGEFIKIVEVENTGGSAAYVRLRVEKTITLPAGAAGGTDPALVVLDINSADWTLRDGLYYYNHALEPGETTAPLFTSVRLDTAMDNLYKNSAISIGVTAYATQSANNGATALEASGWPSIA